MSDNALAAVLWDMDGTLIDSEPLWLDAELAVLDRYGLTMTPALRDSLIGSGLWDAAERFRTIGVPMTADEIVAEWVDRVAEGLRQTEPEWRPGATALLGSLADAGVPCALVTMSVRRLAEQVAAMLPSGRFDVIIAGDEVDHPKPHPEAYLRGAAALGVPIERCLVIEDSPTGLHAGTASGAVAVGVPNLIELDTVPAHDRWRSLAGLDADELSRRFAALRGSDPHPAGTTDALGARA